MNTSPIIFDIQRADDRQWLHQLREDVENDMDYSESDKAEILDAINLRFSHLNAMALTPPPQGGLAQ